MRGEVVVRAVVKLTWMQQEGRQMTCCVESYLLNPVSLEKLWLHCPKQLSFDWEDSLVEQRYHSSDRMNQFWY